ncbi:hypothetical protein M426DRAFT_319995 [Hypoxylon sp. CI-4A]|nr:hypothetical protein M426DRAFT_319995 [Hypoxylon sp. CI-4A]
MKFAKELEHELVPEWKVKYLNYKAGKKYTKAISKAVNRASIASSTNFGRRDSILPQNITSGLSPFPRQQNEGPRVATVQEETESLSASPAPMGQAVRGIHETPKTQPTPIPIPEGGHPSPKSPGNGERYGSLVPTPPPLAEDWNMFELPAPALDEPATTAPESLHQTISRQSLRRSISMGVGTPATNPQPGHLRRSSTYQNTPSPGKLKRIFTPKLQSLTRSDSAAFGLDMVKQREKDFFDFLDSELDKVETFYRQKEDQAGRRLTVLREQLHEMRNRRTRELVKLKQRKQQSEEGANHDSKGVSSATNGTHQLVDQIKSKLFKPGPNSKALSKLPASTSALGVMGGDAKRDYMRRSPNHEVSYRTAKRKLKLALQEFYRGLELLQSYTQLNRTAFRKLNKKYDKTVHARPPYQYMNEKVNKAWFVNSNTIDGYIHAVEDLYARYFEKGNRKIATGKLHRLNRPPADESAISFQNGLLMGTGAVFALQGLVYGSQLLFDPDPEVQLRTSYLMQIYGGYFLMLLLMFMFCLDCYLWTRNKINYPFIFELDTRHSLDWRQLSGLPSFFLFLFGLFFWINFTRYGSPAMYLYYPVILIGITLFILILPAPVLWHRSRQWLMYSHYRLFFAGLFPVEFRDFFLGDMYCSLTYATSNIELFPCLYANHWDNPAQCNSSNSRLMGFFSALPAIWRLLQCLRRYRDTKNWFPHLANGGKYLTTIMASVTLSLYRIQATDTTLAVFVTFSTINGLYASIWDIFMDFSFFQPDTRHRFLRDILGLKSKWLYYAIMVLDPILRFEWIFYTIFAHDKQHSTLVSFLIAFVEVIRRGMWALLRVENEHCGNVAQYKASRDVPLPYALQMHEPLVERISTDEEERPGATTTATSTAVAPTARKPSVPTIDEETRASTIDVSTAGASALGRQETGASQSQAQAASARDPEAGLRWRRRTEPTHGQGIRGRIANAHMQDFEKRRKPTAETASDDNTASLEADADIPLSEVEEDSAVDDDSDEDSSGSLQDERMHARRSERLLRGVLEDSLDKGARS